jgi:hypothetical protein
MRCTILGAAERDTFEAPACGLHIARTLDQAGKSLSVSSLVLTSWTTEGYLSSCSLALGLLERHV